MSGHADTIRLREHLVAGGRHAFVADLDALLAENQRTKRVARNSAKANAELRAENQRLREALTKIATPGEFSLSTRGQQAFEIAREALAGGDG